MTKNLRTLLQHFNREHWAGAGSFLNGKQAAEAEADENREQQLTWTQLGAVVKTDAVGEQHQKQTQSGSSS